jgi:hypothetical protein
MPAPAHDMAAQDDTHAQDDMVADELDGEVAAGAMVPGAEDGDGIWLGAWARRSHVALPPTS